ncbi:MAG: glucokinase [Terricaulis sp.]
MNRQGLKLKSEGVRVQSETPSIGLVGDIGGTHCRFALSTHGQTELSAPAKYPCADFPDILHAIAAYLAREAPRKKIDWAVIAVAGPVDRDVVTLTNLSWRISGPEIAAKFGMRDVRLINDFTAFARATPLVESEHLIALGDVAHAEAGATMTAVVGAGTGLGVGGLMKTAAGVTPLTTEGGHSTFAPVTPLDLEIARVLRTKFERVSHERLLSGEGLVNIYWALSQLDGASAETLTPRDITRRAIDKSDSRCMRAAEVMSRVLGQYGGDVVLTLGARAGLYVSGGVIHSMIDVFDRAAFREGFENKGRFRGYMEGIPAWIVVHPFAALLGSAALANDTIAPGGGRAASASFA